jgi:hypothetical protein
MAGRGQCAGFRNVIALPGGRKGLLVAYPSFAQAGQAFTCFATLVLTQEGAGPAVGVTVGSAADPPQAFVTVSQLGSQGISDRLAFYLTRPDIGGGRLAADVSLANRVRSGRKQP